MLMQINGSWRGASDGETILVTNPVDGTVIDTVPSATYQDVSEAITASLEGQRAWNAIALHQRGTILSRFVELVEAHREELAWLVCREMGKPIREARGDINTVTSVFTAFVETGKNFLGHAMPFGVQPGLERDFEVMIHEALGTIVCIVPFNVPLILFSHKVAPALIAGNAVVVKPATDNPLALIRLMELLLEAGVPPKAAQIVTGRGQAVGHWLVKDDRIAKVSFTGSTSVGLEIAECAAGKLTRTSLELGGNAPFVVFGDADVALAAEEAFQRRAAYGNGQLCNVSKRFLIHRSVKDQFVQELIARLSTLKSGDPTVESTEVGTLISERAAIEVESQVRYTVTQGARLVHGGVRSGAYYTAAVLDDVTTDMDVAHDMEIFGPVFPIMTFDTYDEAIQMANDTIYGLGAGVFTENMRTAMRFAMDVQAGSVIINGNSGYRSLLMPFGGYKMSGIGREGLTATLDAVTQQKSIVWKNIL